MENAEQNNNEGIVQFSDWEKLNLIVSQIINVEDIEGADKLYKITLNIGSEESRVVCAGLKQYYSKEELQDKKVILFENLSPRKLRGIESKGMILAAVSEDHSKVHLLQPDKDLEVGSSVS